MTDVIGRGVIEVSADATKLKAGIEDAKRSIKSLGIASADATKSQSQSIDRYVKQLGIAAVTTGKSGRELELYKLALRGANAEQLKAADSALRMSEAYAKGQQIGSVMKEGFVLLAKAAIAGATAAVVAFELLIRKAGDFQDMAEKTGDTAVNFASLAVAAGTANTEMGDLVATSIKMNKNLVGVDDDAKAAGAALKALGLDIVKFKELKAADQFETIAKALKKFADGPEKGNVLEGLAKGFAKLQPFLIELGAESGRQYILTQKQLDLADKYADSQSRLRTQLSLYAQSIAIEMIPAISDFAEASKDLIREITGIGGAADSLKDNNSVAGFADEAAIQLARLVDLLRIVGRGFAFLGGGLGANAAIISAVSKGEIGIAISIAKDSFREYEKLTADFESLADRTEARIRARISGSAPGGASGSWGWETEPTFPPFASAPRTKDGRPRLNYEGANTPDKAAKAEAEAAARAQLSFDLDQIKKASEAVTNAYANGEKMLEALHQAGLVEDRDYYAAKRAYLIANESEQEQALQTEIGRLEAEKLVGKDRIDNERKIADARARLSKIQVNSAAEIDVLKVKETSALKAIEQGYRDAEAAAQDYLDTIRRGNARELAGFGVGTQERERMAGRAQIEDRYSEQRNRLERSRRDAEFAGTFGPEAQKKYDAELDRIRRFQALALAEYDDFYAQRLAAESNFVNGANDAFANYISEASKTAKMTEDLFTNAFKGMEDALVTFITTGKLNFNSLANQIVADIVRIIVKQQISNAIGVAGGAGGSGWTGLAASAIGAMFGSGGTTSADLPGFIGARASGGPVRAGGLYRVNENGPELLTVGNKQYLMNGPQAGTVTPNGTTDRSVSVVNNFAITGPVDSRTQQQVALQAGRAVQRAAARFA